MAGTDLDHAIAMGKNDRAATQMLITRFTVRQPEAAGADDRHKERRAPLVPERVLPGSVRLPAPALVGNEDAVAAENHHGHQARDVVAHGRKGGALALPRRDLPRPVESKTTFARPHGNAAKNGSKVYTWSNKTVRLRRKHGGKTHLFEKDWVKTVPGIRLPVSSATFSWLSLANETVVLPPSLPVVVVPRKHHLLAKKLGFACEEHTHNFISKASDIFLKLILTEFSKKAQAAKRLHADLHHADQSGWILNDPKFSYGFGQHFQIGAPLPRHGRVPAPYFKSTVITGKLAHDVLSDWRPLNSLPSLRRYLLLGDQRR